MIYEKPPYVTDNQAGQVRECEESKTKSINVGLFIHFQLVKWIREREQ